MRFALLPIKAKCEHDPALKPYSDVIIDAMREVLEACARDSETQAIVKGISSQILFEEYTEVELRELYAFYRTKTGQKLLSKQAIVSQKQWERESQIVIPKFDQMVADKLQALQREGKLPEKL